MCPPLPLLEEAELDLCGVEDGEEGGGLVLLGGEGGQAPAQPHLAPALPHLAHGW